MKPTPRRAEREIAAILSRQFAELGMSPVERIPVLGREGPDITINEFGLVVDVKDRLEVPKSYIFDRPCFFGDLIAVPISEMELLAGDIYIASNKTSKTVERWFWHMDEWRLKYKPSGITCLVLHRPRERMPYGKSMLVIHKSQKEYFAECLHKPTATPLNASSLPRTQPLPVP